MVLVQMLTESGDGWSETSIVGVFSDHFWAERAIKEHKAEMLEKDETDWDEHYPETTFYLKELKVNERLSL
jgi:lipoprotein NlpI